MISLGAHVGKLGSRIKSIGLVARRSRAHPGSGLWTWSSYFPSLCLSSSGRIRVRDVLCMVVKSWYSQFFTLPSSVIVLYTLPHCFGLTHGVRFGQWNMSARA